MPTASTDYFKNLKLEPGITVLEIISIAGKLKASTSFPLGCILGEQVGTNSIQTITPSTGANLPTGGTLTVTWATHTTSALAFNITASGLQTAIAGLTGVGVGNVLVTGGPLNSGEPFVVTFIGSLGYAPQTAITASAASLTGGTPTLTISQTATGLAGTVGTYAPYVSTNTDGSQVPVAILPFACQTDASGNITLSDTSSQTTNEFGATGMLSIPVYVGGIFQCADMPASGTVGGLDGTVPQSKGWRIISGTITAGLLRLT